MNINSISTLHTWDCAKTSKTNAGQRASERVQRRSASLVGGGVRTWSPITKAQPQIPPIITASGSNNSSQAVVLSSMDGCWPTIRTVSACSKGTLADGGNNCGRTRGDAALDLAAALELAMVDSRADRRCGCAPALSEAFAAPSLSLIHI